MTTLYSYVLRVDDGAAPNPFWGTCTLAICKPKIRSVAKVGDWIVGTGSKNTPIGDASGTLVYAMRVTKKLSMRDYDRLTGRELTRKVPNWASSDPRDHVGDSVYDFTTDPPRVRPSVHTERNRDRDLSGNHVLLSTHFYYLGARPLELPPHLRPLARQGQGHQSQKNAALVEPFIEWLDGLGLESGRALAAPQFPIPERLADCDACAEERDLDDDEGVC